MNKDLMGGGVILIIVGVYAIFLLARRRIDATSSAISLPATNVKLPATVAKPKVRKETVEERFNRIKNTVREQMRAIGMKPPGGEIPDLPTRRKSIIFKAGDVLRGRPVY